eukprot:30536-Eustigmatos_ZCMA.PRE.1
MPMPCSPEITPSSERASHVVVIRVDRQVSVHVAVAGVHVQGHEHAAAQHLLVDRLRLVEDRLELAAVEDLAQLGADLRLP